MDIYYPQPYHAVSTNDIWGDELKALLTSELEDIIAVIEAEFPTEENDYIKSPRWMIRKYNHDRDGKLRNGEKATFYEARICHPPWDRGEYDSGFGYEPITAFTDALKEARRRKNNNWVQTYPNVERALASYAKKMKARSSK